MPAARPFLSRAPILGASLIALSACSASPGEALRVVTGSVSQFLCVGAFVTGEEPARVYAQTFEPIRGSALFDWGVRYTVDRVERTVSTRFVGGFESRAAYREGTGCRLLFAAEPEPDQTRANTPAPPDLPPIAGPEVAATADPALIRALDDAFTETAGQPPRNTKAVVILKGGAVIAERYAPGYGPRTPLAGNSMTKSVTASLLGILARDGKLDIRGPAPVAAWAAGDPRHAITVDDLLRMRSGLDLGDSAMATAASIFSPSNIMQFAHGDTAAFAERVSLAAVPGTGFAYADGSTAILSRILRDRAGAEGFLGFARRELFDPLGMRDVVFGLDEARTPMGANGMQASARDWARLGQLYLDQGMAGDRRLLPAGWTDYVSRPTPDAWIGYGAGFWTNAGDSPGARRRTGLGMPADSYFARGKFGQFMVIAPSAGLVVVRLGTAHGDEETAGVARLVKAAVAAGGRDGGGIAPQAKR